MAELWLFLFWLLRFSRYSTIDALEGHSSQLPSLQYFQHVPPRRYIVSRVSVSAISRTGTYIDHVCRPPDLFYNEKESKKYTTSSRIQNIQAEMTSRALEVLDLKTPSLILDIGCGSGLSGEMLSEVTPEEGGPHAWVGMDISESMLEVAQQRDTDGDLFHADIGQGIPFRAGTFDAAISISAIQWLCNAESSDVSPEGRLRRFFDGLYASLKRGARAACQFYPRNDAQKNMICAAAMRAGFGAGLLEDGPGTKNHKIFLILTVGGGGIPGGDINVLLQGAGDVDIVDARKKGKGAWKRKGPAPQDVKGSKAWIMRKKDQLEQKGKITKASSKYTGRKRRPKF